MAADSSLTGDDAVLMGAVDFGHHYLAAWLLDQGANPNARADERAGQTALHSAAWNGDLAMVRLLVRAGADRDALDRQYGATPRGWAQTAITVTANDKCAAVVAYFDGGGE
jgi:ankyrin repeat protein